MYCMRRSLYRARVIHCTLHKSGEVVDHQRTGNDDFLKKSLGSNTFALGSLRLTFCNAVYNKREFKYSPLFYYKSRKKNNVTPCQIWQIIALGWVICSDRILTILVIHICLTPCNQYDISRTDQKQYSQKSNS